MSTAGLLLTGGASRRLGADKAALVLDGTRLVDRLARLLLDCCDPVLEVGPGYGLLDAVREDPPGSGPLAAVAAGAAALEATGHRGPALVLAVDLPGVDRALLRWLVDHPASGNVVPIVADIPQVLCARYSFAALARAAALVDAGERSMRSLMRAVDTHEAGEREWRSVAAASVFTDVDSREAAAAAGIDLPR